MKNIKIKMIAFCALAAVASACGDEHNYFPLITKDAEGAKVKLVHAASDAAAINFFVNGVKVTSGAAAGSGLAYASSFPGVNYSILTPGTSEVKVLTPPTATVPSSTLLTSSVNTENNLYYTVAFAGISPNYETVVIADDFSGIPYDGKSYVKFVNLIHNSADKLKVVAKLGAAPNQVVTVLAENIAYKQSTGFVALDAGDYTIELVNNTTGAVITTANATNKLVVGNRIYTLFARGQIGGTTTKAPTLDRLVIR